MVFIEAWSRGLLSQPLPDRCTLPYGRPPRYRNWQHQSGCFRWLLFLGEPRIRTKYGSHDTVNPIFLIKSHTGANFMTSDALAWNERHMATRKTTMLMLRNLKDIFTCKYHSDDDDIDLHTYPYMYHELFQGLSGATHTALRNVYLCVFAHICGTFMCVHYQGGLNVHYPRKIPICYRSSLWKQSRDRIALFK